MNCQNCLYSVHNEMETENRKKNSRAIVTKEKHDGTAKIAPAAVDENQTVICRRNPPQSFMIPVQTQFQGMQMAQQTVFPVVQKNWHCGEWSDNKQGVVS